MEEMVCGHCDLNFMTSMFVTVNDIMIFNSIVDVLSSSSALFIDIRTVKNMKPTSSNSAETIRTLCPPSEQSWQPPLEVYILAKPSLQAVHIIP